MVSAFARLPTRHALPGSNSRRRANEVPPRSQSHPVLGEDKHEVCFSADTDINPTYYSIIVSNSVVCRVVLITKKCVDVI